MTIEEILIGAVQEAVKALYGAEVTEQQVQLQKTKAEFEGHLTVVVFPFVKAARKSPEQVGTELGQYLTEHVGDVVAKFNVVKGFLNLVINDASWITLLNQIHAEERFGFQPVTVKSPLVMIEYSSPNTNKPLHLGHVRNNLLGAALARIVEANGNKVVKTNIVNDRGIHICKSMLAWLKWGNGETPQSTGIKGDHLVGKYYVAFSNELKKEAREIAERENIKEDDAEKRAPILKEAQSMLVKWESGDKEIRSLWERMNGWVYSGFNTTYERLGISFDRIYYESQTYLLGKSIVQEGLKKGIFDALEDASVWCNLESDGLDRKLLLRGDGTSVYMTQDLGTAVQRFGEYKFDEMIYVVGDEQNYHFKVLKLILKKLGYDWSDSIYHLSYGMVELPEGKMKSREGTVVDADDLLERMYQTAKETSIELGKLADMTESDQEKLFEMIGLGALKYFIVKVDPRKTMLFDPKESIDFNGNTGPFIQYTHARIMSILRKAFENGILEGDSALRSAVKRGFVDLHPKEVEIIKILNSYPMRIKEAGDAHSPALIANYIYDLAKEFNQYYQTVTILKEEKSDILQFRLSLIYTIASVLRKGMSILGIELPDRM